MAGLNVEYMYSIYAMFLIKNTVKFHIVTMLIFYFVPFMFLKYKDMNITNYNRPFEDKTNSMNLHGDRYKFSPTCHSGRLKK